MIMIIMTVEKAGDYSKTGEFHDGRLWRYWAFTRYDRRSDDRML